MVGCYLGEPVVLSFISLYRRELKTPFSTYAALRESSVFQTGTSAPQGDQAQAESGYGSPTAQPGRKSSYRKQVLRNRQPCSPRKTQEHVHYLRVELAT